MTLLETLIDITGDANIAEKVNSSLGEFMIPKGTFNDLNRKYKALETETNSVRQQLAEKDTELEKVQTANMTDIEKMQHKLETYEQDLAKRDFDNNKLSAKTALTKAGLTDEEIEKIVNVHVSADSEQSEQAIALFVDVLASKTSAAEQTVKDRLYHEDTKVDDEGDTPLVTDELTFDKFKGMEMAERTQLFESKPEVYKEFTKQERE